MPCATAPKSAGASPLYLLLLLMLLVGCHSSDPPPEKDVPESEPFRKITGPLPSAIPPPASLEPVLASPPPPANLVDISQLPASPSQRDETGNVSSSDNNRPRIAIIIDDMGQNLQLGRQFLQLDLNLTYAFLPDALYTAELAKTAFHTGRDILVHLPMEPKDGIWNLGADGLMVRDSPKRIREKMARMLRAVPHAVGANNHMGSRFTEDEGAMQVVIESLKDQSFFFIDSLTTAGSRGLTTARTQGVPSARRYVFLDNFQDPLKICQQMEHLIAGAKKQGGAIGVGHPNRAMLTALTHCTREPFHEVHLVGAHWLIQ